MFPSLHIWGKGFRESRPLGINLAPVGLFSLEKNGEGKGGRRKLFRSLASGGVEIIKGAALRKETTAGEEPPPMEAKTYSGKFFPSPCKLAIGKRERKAEEILRLNLLLYWHQIQL